MWNCSLKAGGSFCRFEVDVWKMPSPIPREELLKRIPGKDALYCLLTEKIDKEVLDAAGKDPM